MTSCLKKTLGVGTLIFFVGCSTDSALFVEKEDSNLQPNSKLDCWNPGLDPDDPDYFEPIHDPDCYNPDIPYPDDDGFSNDGENNQNGNPDPGHNDNSGDENSDPGHPDDQFVKQPIDDDFDDRWLDTHCSTGTALPSHLALSSAAKDIDLLKIRRPHLVEEALNLTAQDVRGPLLVQKAERVLYAIDLRGGTSIRANHIDLIEHNRGPVKLSALSVEQLTDLRGPLKVTAHNIGNIYDNRGPLCISAHSVDRLENNRGPVRLFGQTKDGQRARIEVIENTRGPIFLDNIDVGRIENARGPIFIRNGSVDERIDHKGPVR